MIKSFSDSDTEAFFNSGKARWLQSEAHKRATMRLQQLDAAVEVDDLRIPPSNHLEALSGDREGQWSIRINLRWRVCFRFLDGDAYDVGIVDYH
jgi:proteic killer suppression protein